MDSEGVPEIMQPWLIARAISPTDPYDTPRNLDR
jgi:hypothetical protein